MIEGKNKKQDEEYITFYDQVDTKTSGTFKKVIQSGGKIDNSSSTNKQTSEQKDGNRSPYKRKLINLAEAQVRENEDASLQDDSYTFDEDNTSDDEYHDVDEDFKFEDTDVDYDNDEDFVR